MNKITIVTTAVKVGQDVISYVEALYGGENNVDITTRSIFGTRKGYRATIKDEISNGAVFTVGKISSKTAMRITDEGITFTEIKTDPATGKPIHHVVHTPSLVAV